MQCVDNGKLFVNTKLTRVYCRICVTHCQVWVIVSTNSVAYLGGGPRCDGPPFGPTRKIFYRRLYVKRCVFCHFSARIAKFNNVWWSFAFPNFKKLQKQKVFQLQGGFASPDPSTRGSTPGPRWGLRALAMAPLCQILNTPLYKLIAFFTSTLNNPQPRVSCVLSNHCYISSFKQFHKETKHSEIKPFEVSLFVRHAPILFNDINAAVIVFRRGWARDGGRNTSTDSTGKQFINWQRLAHCQTRQRLGLSQWSVKVI